MIKLFKDALKISYNNIIIATPLLLFLLILNVYLVIAKNAVKTLPSTILFFLTLFLMISAFFAGWFYMIKVAVYNYKNETSEKTKDSYSLLNEFPAGIADYIKPFCGFVLLYVIFSDIAFFSVYQAGIKLIGGVGISLSQFYAATEAPIAMQTLLESLTRAQLMKINYWYLLTLVAVLIFSVVTLFWPIEIFYSTKNPIIAFFKSVSRIFTHPQIILLFLYIVILNFILLIFNYISMFNPITYFIMTLIFFAFIVYVFVLLFLYYDEKIKSNSNSSADSNGKE